MNCLYEAVAELYMRVRVRFVPEPNDELGTAEESLQACRANLFAKERELSLHCAQLARAALAQHRAGDLAGARFQLQERRRNSARLDKLRNGITLVEKQLDTLRSSELDKELMRSLRDSSSAMKRAGLGVGIEEAETVMTELDDQIREASELTSVLAAPIVEDEDDFDLDAELGLLAREEAAASPSPLPAAAAAPARARPAAEPARSRPAPERAPLLLSTQ